MKATAILLAAASALSLVSAASPVVEVDSLETHIPRRIECPENIDRNHVGECNGYSCRIPTDFFGAKMDHRCKMGSCVGPGGGDGACCGRLQGGKWIRCPVGKNGKPGWEWPDEEV